MEISDNDINPNFFYRGNDILKIWEQYLKLIDAEMQFFNGDKYYSSIFKDIAQLDESVIVLDDLQHPYQNKDSRSITLLGEIDFMGMERIRKFVKAFQQIKEYNNDSVHKFKIQNHLMIFPYHANEIHWNLGLLDINVNKDLITSVQIYVFEPLGGKARIASETISDILKVVMKNSIEKVKIDINLIDNVRQQHDGSSCGAISAENGKEFLKKINDNDNLLAKIYEQGALLLRKRHIYEINSQKFIDAQKKNIAYEYIHDKSLDASSQEKLKKFLDSYLIKQENKTAIEMLKIMERRNFSNEEKAEELRKANDYFKEFLIKCVKGNTKIKEIIFKKNDNYENGVYDFILSYAADRFPRRICSYVKKNKEETLLTKTEDLVNFER